MAIENQNQDPATILSAHPAAKIELTDGTLPRVTVEDPGRQVVERLMEEGGVEDRASAKEDTLSVETGIASTEIGQQHVRVDKAGEHVVRATATLVPSEKE